MKRWRLIGGGGTARGPRPATARARGPAWTPGRSAGLLALDGPEEVDDLPDRVLYGGRVGPLGLGEDIAPGRHVGGAMGANGLTAVDLTGHLVEGELPRLSAQAREIAGRGPEFAGDGTVTLPRRAVASRAVSPVGGLTLGRCGAVRS